MYSMNARGHYPMREGFQSLTVRFAYPNPAPLRANLFTPLRRDLRLRLRYLTPQNDLASS